MGQIKVVKISYESLGEEQERTKKILTLLLSRYLILEADEFLRIGFIRDGMKAKPKNGRQNE